MNKKMSVSFLFLEKYICLFYTPNFMQLAFPFNLYNKTDIKTNANNGKKNKYQSRWSGSPKIPRSETDNLILEEF